MYQFIVFSLVVAVTSATPGNLAIGLGTGTYGGGGGYGSGYVAGPANGNQITAASGAIGAATISATPVAVSTPVAIATPIVTASVPALPIATSSQSRVDIINPRPIVSQIVSSVPVNVPLGYTVTGYGGLAAGSSLGAGGAAVASGGTGGGNRVSVGNGAGGTGGAGYGGVGYGAIATGYGYGGHGY